MARVIILGDLHLRHHQADTILSWEEGYDRAIFLGDVFDQWSDTVEKNVDAALWLKAKLTDPRNVFCVGNHDWAYVWADNPWSFCSGWTAAKHFAIRRALGQDGLDQLRPFHVEHDILFSHAGLDAYLPTLLASSGYPYPASMDLAGITQYLTDEWPHVRTRYNTRSLHPLMEAGSSRGGLQRVGGMIWQDFHAHMPIPGVAQIVGHTIMDANKGPLFRLINKDGAPMWRHASKGMNPRWLKNGWTLCMDTDSKHYAVLDTAADTLTIKAVKWVRLSGQNDFHVEPGKIVATIYLREPAAIATPIAPTP